MAVGFDCVAWLIGYAIFAWLRMDQVAIDVPWSETLSVAVATAGLYLIIARLALLHHGRTSTGSLEQMLMLGAVTCLAGGLVFAVNLVGHWIPRSVPPGATLFALVLTGYGRATWRRLAERDRRAPGGAGEATRVLVVGAGDAGRDLLGSMRQDPIHRWEPVGLLDDDPRKRHLRLRGVPVLGPTDKLAVEVERTGASTVVLALPSADADTIDCDSTPSTPGRPSRCCRPRPNCCTSGSASRTCATST